MVSLNHCRQSNMELLRIVAMMMVLVLHCTFLSIGQPTAYQMHTATSSSILKIISESFSLVCVDAFVLLSGWFGIHFKRKNLATLFFQGLFLIALTSAVVHSINGKSYPLLRILFMSDGWFIPSYIILYCTAPLLNIYLEQTNRTTQRHILLLLFGVLFFFGWLGSAGDYSRGYSALTFIDLYLLARFVRTSRHPWFLFSASRDLLVYIALSALTSLLVCLSLATGSPFIAGLGMQWGINYISPLTLCATLYLLLFFSKLHLRNNRFVNWVAASAFAVYIIHAATPVLGAYFKPAVVYLHTNYNLPSFVLLTAAFMVGVFAACILIDQIRILAWKGLLIGFQKYRSYRQRS